MISDVFFWKNFSKGFPKQFLEKCSKIPPENYRGIPLKNIPRKFLEIRKSFLGDLKNPTGVSSGILRICFTKSYTVFFQIFHEGLFWKIVQGLLPRFRQEFFRNSSTVFFFHKYLEIFLWIPCFFVKTIQRVSQRLLHRFLKKSFQRFYMKLFRGFLQKSSQRFLQQIFQTLFKKFLQESL